MLMERLKRYPKYIICIGYPLVWILWSFLFYKFLFLHGGLISLDDAGTRLAYLICQHIVVNLPVWALVILEAGKRNGACFNPPRKISGKIILGLEIAIYLGLFVYGLSLKSDFVQVLYAAVFYLFMVSFPEEFIYRGWMPALSENAFPKWAVRIIPNLLFTLSHYVMLFVDDEGIRGIGATELLIFFFSTMVFGLLMELIKRRTQSLWIVIFFHAVYDYYGEIMLWL